MAITEITDKSAILQLFENIETALEDTVQDGTIYSVEVFNSQTDFEKEEKPHLYPFVMIDISVQWDKIEAKTTDNSLRNIKQNWQKGNCTVTVHHVFSHLDNETTSFKETEPIRHEVHRAINLLEDENWHTKLQRISTLVDSSHNRVMDFISVYQCYIIEQAYKDEDKETVTDPSVVITASLDIDNETIRTGDGEI
jgi:hypothetical protein